MASDTDARVFLSFIGDSAFAEGKLDEISSFDSNIRVTLRVPAPQSYEPPQSVFGYKSEIQAGRRGPRALPDVWWTETLTDRGLTLFGLKHAHVFGGAITKREGRIHSDGQLLLTGEQRLFSQSYGVMDGSPTLPEDLVGFDADRPFLKKTDLPVTHLSGTYLFLGSLHHHFGHVLVEGLSRLWGYWMLPESLRQNLKLLIYEPNLRPFASALLSLAGLGEDHLVFCPPHAVVERLIVPSPSLRTHHWIFPEQAMSWDKIAAGAESGMASERPVYLSRRNIAERTLAQEEAISDLFANAGFDIVSPESLTVSEQIARMRRASIIAGCVGSAMYLAAFRKPGGKTLVLAPRNFYLKDDALIAHARQSSLSVVFGSEIDFTPPKNRRSWTIDESAVREAIAAVLKTPEPSA